MLWYCRFSWHSGTTANEVRRRVVQQHEAGTNHPEQIRGWYNLAGGGAGFLMIETEDFKEVTAFCAPYADLVAWDVRAVYALDYEETIQSMRRIAKEAPHQPATAR